MTLWIAALAAGVAVAWVLPYGRSSPRRRPDRASSDEIGLLRRLRAPLSALAGVAGWTFVGGVGGVVLGCVLVVVAWRALTNAPSASHLQRQAQLRADYPLVVELVATVVAAGADVGTALREVGAAVGEPWASRLAVCVHGLTIGQPPEAVWAELEADPQTAALGRAFGRSAQLGVPVADAMRRLAHDLREESHLAAHASARSIEVKAAAPLGVCFLPAFVLLGVVPLVAGVLGTLAWVGR